MKYWSDKHRTLYNGNCRSMSELADNSIQCCVTSPPYWGLRKYAGEQDSIWGGRTDCSHEWGESKTFTTGRHDADIHKRRDNDGSERDVVKETMSLTGPGVSTCTKGQFCSLCGAWRGSYGLEPTVEMYVQHTVEILREIRRVLRKDGVCFWNVGDSYASTPDLSTAGSNMVGTTISQDASKGLPKRTFGDIKPKDLCLIPFRVAIAAQEDGWYVRSVIIWNKPNPMPESVTDRPTDSYEHIIMMTKSAKYYWDMEAVRENCITGNGESQGKANGKRFGGSETNPVSGFGERELFNNPNGRNLRSVWTFPTQPYSDWGYDYAGADYVGDDGKPYKLSLDCPIHERHPEKGIQKRASYDERLNHRENGIIDNSNGHALTPESESVSTLAPGVVMQVDDSVRGQNSGNTHDHKTSDEGMVEPRIIAHIEGTQTIPASSMDSMTQDSAQTAIESSKQNRKKGRVPLTSQPYNASVENDTRIDGKPVQSSLIDSVAHTSANNNVEDSVSSEKATNPLAGTLFRNADKSYSNYICNCRISQTSHFATFPEALPERCIKAATPEVGCCSKCGTPWERITESQKGFANGVCNSCGQPENKHIVSAKSSMVNFGEDGRTNKAIPCSINKTLGWQPGCKCNAGKVPSIVLDPFCGSGTTLEVAAKLNRHAVGYEISEEYCQLIVKRNNQSCLL